MQSVTVGGVGAIAALALGAATPCAKMAAMGELSALLPTWADAPADVEFSRFFCRDAERGEFSRLELVTPDKVPRRRSSTASGRAALLHSIAHIEYAAVDLALDHALRFDGMPTRYYLDWLRVAADEARHFEMLRAHLQTLGYDYGDFPAHAGLWQMAARTAHDVLARMAMVPRLLEARGLDATPPIQRKLAEAGDEAAVRLLEVILHDEEDHVRLGDGWFRQLCNERGLEPELAFRELIVQYQGPWPQTPMNIPSRLAAGFSAAELNDLTRLRPAR